MVHLELGRSNAQLLRLADELAEQCQVGVLGIAACPPVQIVAAVFRWLEPYAEGLWSRSISDFAACPQDCHWRKETRFGGL